MSNLVVSNISDGTTSVGTGYVVNGSAKAWLHSASDATLYDSFNISSSVDVIVGDSQFYYTNSFISANYSATCNPRITSGASYTGVPTTSSNSGSLYTRGHRSSSDVETDMRMNAAMFGDLA